MLQMPYPQLSPFPASVIWVLFHLQTLAYLLPTPPPAPHKKIPEQMQAPALA